MKPGDVCKVNNTSASGILNCPFVRNVLPIDTESAEQLYPELEVVALFGVNEPFRVNIGHLDDPLSEAQLKSLEPPPGFQALNLRRRNGPDDLKAVDTLFSQFRGNWQMLGVVTQLVEKGEVMYIKSTTTDIFRVVTVYNVPVAMQPFLRKQLRAYVVLASAAPPPL